MTLRVALTGGIATGKSYCLARFADLGVAVIDADQVAHTLLTTGTPTYHAVAGRFGLAVLRDDGQVDRRALGRIVFTDAAARRDLEAIIHPAVYDVIETWFASAAGAFAIADIPLLYETGRSADFDRVIVAACRPAQQLERLLARGGLSEDEARQRIASQLPIDDKVPRADYVIDTSATLADTDRQVLEVWEKLRAITQT